MNKMIDYAESLFELGIPKEKIYALDIFEKSSSTWKQLVDDLKSLPSADERIRVIDKILEKAEIRSGKKVSLLKVSAPEKLMTPKFHKVKDLAVDFLEKEKKVVCLKYEPDLKEISEEFDLRKECKGAPIYVCHHCGRNMCSQHSYWIPDKDFPYIVKKTFESKLKKDEEKERKAKNQIRLGAFLVLLGCIMIPFWLSYYFGIMAIMLSIFLWLIGIPLIALGYKKLKEIFFEEGRFYPTFKKVIDTKWNREIEVKFEHQGYYTAVHCWECLKQEHPEIYQVGIKILTEVYRRSENWKRLRGDVQEKIPDELRKKCGILAANIYLNEFKFGWRCYLPLNNVLRVMERPKFPEYEKYWKPAKEGVFYPTPIWLFEPVKDLKTRRVPSTSIAAWINWNEKRIKKAYKII
ncbi:MAG: hypothetical protein ACTSVV_19370 [Promethearchaeota archaeon]